MFDLSGIPAVTPRVMAEKQASGDDFILLDVREPVELTYANLGEDATHLPLSKLAEYGVEVLPTAVTADKMTEIIVMCHHGVRSAQVTRWLRGQGWQNVFNLTGGIDAYAGQIDPDVGRY